MPPIRTSTIPHQVADHLREQLMSGRLTDAMPGRDVLAVELGVSPRSVQGALKILEKEGLIVAQGVGKPRRINIPAHAIQTAGLRVAVLPYAREDPNGHYVVQLRHHLEKAGHPPLHIDNSLLDLKRDVKRVARLVRKIQADAWIVDAGPSEVLRWFAEQDIPVFGLFGRIVGLPIAGAGPNKAPAIAEMVRELVGLGHQRIVRLCHRQSRAPKPNLVALAYIDGLKAAGIATSDYHMPDWEESKHGFIAALDSLFQLTPPTALILDAVHLYSAAHHYLSARGLRVPQDVSLVCEDRNPTFTWCEPSVAHIDWELRPVIRRAVRWANNIARGKNDRRQTLSKSKFVMGGTVSQAKNDC